MNLDGTSFSDLAYTLADLLCGICKSLWLQQVKAEFNGTPTKQFPRLSKDKKEARSEALWKERIQKCKYWLLRPSPEQYSSILPSALYPPYSLSGSILNYLTALHKLSFSAF